MLINVLHQYITISIFALLEFGYLYAMLLITVTLIGNYFRSIINIYYKI
jgi:hypothetical protein